MSVDKRFIDTNILLYLLSEDQDKAERAEEVLSLGGVVSVQVLNEFASTSLRKLKMTCPEVREIIDVIRELCTVVPVTLDTHSLGLDIVERYRFSFYDALIIASALENGCSLLFTEDLQHGQHIDKKLGIHNPFFSRS